MPDTSPAAANQRSRRWLLSGAAAVAVVVAVVFLALPALAGLPARLIKGCGKWMVTAGALELVSGVGFVVFFKLVFAAPVSWGHSIPAGLRALGASTILPGGALIGPSLGAWSTATKKPSVSQLSRSTVAFVILTNAPGAIVVVVVALLLWLGLARGPRDLSVTLLPALLAVGFLAVSWLGGRSSGRQPSSGRPAKRWRRLAKSAEAVRDGLAEAQLLVRAGHWMLVGALAYYAFDNAVLWATFHAYGHVPPLGVVVMGYLVGSVAGVLPLPAGLGVLDGGLIGALVLYGAPAAPAAAAVLLYRGISLLLPIALGLAGVAWNPSGRRPLGVAGRLRRPAEHPAGARVATAQIDGP